jgi:tight adherence protein B
MSGLFDEPIYLVVGVCVFIVLLCVLFAFGDGKGEQAKRVDKLKTRGQLTPTEQLQLRRQGNGKSTLDLLVQRFMPRPELLRERLHRTGRKISLGTYGIVCLVVALGATALVSFMGNSLFIAAPIGALAGIWLPHLVVGAMASRRATAFGKHFPEAIGLMVRGLKSGLPVTETFVIVGNEVLDPVGGEFRQISDQIRLGNAPETALWDAAKRIGTPELKFLVVTLSIQRETGGNLAETLENLDSILRRRRQMKLKVKAMSSEARASAGIIGALPFLVTAVLYFVAPDYIMTLFNTTGGHHTLAYAAGMMGTGFGVIYKMIRFDI